MNLHRDEVRAIPQFVGVDVVREKIGITRPQRCRLGGDLPLGQIEAHNLASVQKHQRAVIAQQPKFQSVEPADIPHRDRFPEPSGDVFFPGIIAEPDSRRLVALAIAKLRGAFEPVGVIELTADPIFIRRLAGVEIAPTAAFGYQHRFLRVALGHHLKLDPGRLHRLAVHSLRDDGENEFANTPILPFIDVRLGGVREHRLAIDREHDLLDRLATEIGPGLDVRDAGGLDARLGRRRDANPRHVTRRLSEAKRHSGQPSGQPSALSGALPQIDSDTENALTFCRLAKRFAGSLSMNLSDLAS